MGLAARHGFWKCWSLSLGHAARAADTCSSSCNEPLRPAGTASGRDGRTPQGCCAGCGRYGQLLPAAPRRRRAGEGCVYLQGPRRSLAPARLVASRAQERSLPWTSQTRGFLRSQLAFILRTAVTLQIPSGLLCPLITERPCVPGSDELPGEHYLVFLKQKHGQIFLSSLWDSRLPRK